MSVTGRLASELSRTEAAVSRARELIRETRLAKHLRQSSGGQLSMRTAHLTQNTRENFSLVRGAVHVRWLLDHSGRLLTPAPSWLSFTGQSLADVLDDDGLGWLRAVHVDDRAHLQAGLAGVVERGECYERTIRVLRGADGDFGYRHMLLRLVPVANDDVATLEVVCIGIDQSELAQARVTAQNAAVAARIALDRAFQAAASARSSAERVNLAQRHQLAAVSHDLRTPLSAIMGYTQLLDEQILGEVNEQQHEALRKVRAASEHVLALVNDLLEAAREDRAEPRLDITNVDAVRTCDEVIDLMQPAAAGCGVVLSCATPDGETAQLRADGRRVLQILGNLVANALRFSERGGHVVLTVHTSLDAVSITVSDDGCGIVPEDHERIFERFAKIARPVGDAATPDESPHHFGLGLAICRDLARRMMGDVTVSSVPGHGASFTLTLPAAPISGPTPHV